MKRSVTKRHGASDSDVFDPVVAADIAYRLEELRYHLSPRKTKVAELRLLKARAALRLACSVHSKQKADRSKQ